MSTNGSLPGNANNGRSSAASAKSIQLQDKIKDLTNKELLIFGDVEGAVPAVDSLFEKNDKEIDKEIKIKLAPEQHLILLGDITDMSTYDIRWLKAIKQLYESQSNNITTIIGNRDINKIRLRDECFLVTKDDKLPWEDKTKNFTDLCIDIATNFDNYKFLFEASKIIDNQTASRFFTKSKKNEIYFTKSSFFPHWKNKTKSDDKFYVNSTPNPNYKSNGLDRISTLYVTLGASDVIKNRYEELRKLDIIHHGSVINILKFSVGDILNILNIADIKSPFINIFKNNYELKLKKINSEINKTIDDISNINYDIYITKDKLELEEQREKLEKQRRDLETKRDALLKTTDFENFQIINITIRDHIEKFDDNYKFIKDNKIFINIQYAAIILSNMLMTFKWSQNLLTNLNDNLKTLNGLHVDYLLNSKLIDFFTHNSKKYLISHTGIPPYLSYPLGFAPLKNNSQHSQDLNLLIDIINKLNEEKNDFINNYLDTINKKTTLQIIEHYKNTLNNENLVKFVQLSANTGLRIYENEDYVAGSYLATMFGHSLNNIMLHPFFKFKDEIKNIKKGGYWSDSWDNKNYINMIELCKSAPIDYNIFGHQPQLLFPIALVKDKTTHVCLDVSMMNRKSHIETGAYAYMKVNNDRITINGRFRFNTKDGFDINYYYNDDKFYLIEKDKYKNFSDNNFIEYDMLINEFIKNNEFTINENYKTFIENPANYTNFINFIKDNEFGINKGIDTVITQEFEKFNLTKNSKYNFNKINIDIDNTITNFKLANEAKISSNNLVIKANENLNNAKKINNAAIKTAEIKKKIAEKNLEFATKILNDNLQNLINHLIRNNLPQSINFDFTKNLLKSNEENLNLFKNEFKSQFNIDVLRNNVRSELLNKVNNDEILKTLLSSTINIDFHLLNQNILGNKNIMFALTKNYGNYCFIKDTISFQKIGGSKKNYTKTPQKLKIGNRSHVIYKGSRGAQYIKKNNEFVNIRKLKK